MNDVEVNEAPKNIKLEQEILGAIIENDKLIEQIAETLKVSAFYEQQHKDIYIAMLYLHNNNSAIGYDTLINRLKYTDVDEETQQYVFKLGESVATSSNIENKVELLKETYEKRELYKEALYIVTNNIEGVSSQNLIKKFEEKIENMGVTSNIEYEKFEDYIDDWIEYQKDETPVQSHNLGFALLNEYVLLEDTNLMLIGARPSVGKSAFATNLVKNFCLQGKHPLFVSLEMNKKEFMNRLVSNMAHVKARKLKRKEHKSKEEWDAINHARDLIRDFKFNFYDKGGMKIEQLVGLAKYLKKKDELDMIVIDYLQLLETNQFKGQKQNQVGFISQKLKQLAMQLEIPIIALSQLNRGVMDGGKVREPQLSDLRDSGSLEQDSNIVIMLHTTDIEQKFGNDDDKNGNGRFIDLFIRKNRDGKLGHIKYSYFGDYVDFIEKDYINGRWQEVPKPNLYPKKEQNNIQEKEYENIDIKEEDLPF